MATVEVMKSNEMTGVFGKIYIHEGYLDVVGKEELRITSIFLA